MKMAVFSKNKNKRVDDENFYRICPSKLSRRELENLYFSLLENNVDMKKNMNLQQEKIKALSVKVQRLSNPRNTGAGTPTIVNEQKESIIQLRRANERMAEKIRVLNMRLSSVKQFAGKIGTRNLNNANLSSSITKSTCTSCVNLVTAGPSQAETNSVETQTDFFAEKYSNSSCDIKCKPAMNELNEKINCDIKCKPTMNAMNEKINNLQEELQTSGQRIEKLEALVMRLQSENQAVRGEHAASEHALQQQDALLRDLKDKLRRAEAKVNDMHMELTIEKKKLAELETELKLTENIGTSSSVAKTIEQIEQKKVRGKVNAPLDEANSIRDKGSDEVYRAHDKVQFIRGEVINEGKNEVNTIPSDEKNNLGDAMAKTEMNSEPDDTIFTRREKDVAKNEVNKAPFDLGGLTWGDFMSGTYLDMETESERLTDKDDMNMTKNEINLAHDKSRNGDDMTRNEVDKVPSGNKLTRGEDMTKNEDSLVLADTQSIRYVCDETCCDMRKNDVNRVPNDVENNWGDIMIKSNVQTVPDDKISAKKDIDLKNGEKTLARNKDSREPEDKQSITSEEINITRNKVNRIPDNEEYNWGDFMTRSKVKDDTITVKKDVNMTSDTKNEARNEVNRIPDEEYNWGKIMKNNEADGQETEEKTSQYQVTSLRDDVNVNPEYTQKQDINKNIEIEKDQPNLKLNQELINKISELVSQLEKLKITAAGEAFTVTDKIVKEEPTEFKSHNAKMEKPDAVDSSHKQKHTRKETEHTSSQAKKEKLMQFKLHEAKLISSPTSINKQKPTQKSYDDNTNIISSQRDKESSYITTGTTDIISIQSNRDKPMKYESCDMKAEIVEISPLKDKVEPTVNGSNYVGSKKDLENKMIKALAKYESVDIATEEADNILSNRSNVNAPKYKSYDYETKESDDMLTHHDTIECIMEINSANERSKFKNQYEELQEPVSTNEMKGMSRGSKLMRVHSPSDQVDNFYPSHEQIAEKLNVGSAVAQGLESNTIPRSAQIDAARYQIPGPISGDFNDQKRDISKDPYIRNHIDATSSKNTDSHKITNNIEKSNQISSMSESTLKSMIDEKSAKRKDSFGESLRKISLKEKSEKIRKTFRELPNRISFQQSSQDNIRKPFHDLTTRQSFDEKSLKISDNNDGEIPIKKRLDPLSTRLSFSPKTTLIIKDYARDVEANARKTRPRFSEPSATLIDTPDSSRISQPVESILKSKNAATASTANSEPGVNDGMDVGGYVPPFGGVQENAVGIEPATVAHINGVEETFEICGASALICVCPRSEPRGESAFQTCNGNIRFRTTQLQDNMRFCAYCTKDFEHHDRGTGVGAPSRSSATSMDNRAPRTYSIADKQSRATSPDNTDHEISSMTEWTSDKDGHKSPRFSLEAGTRADSLSEKRGTAMDTDGPSEQYTTASEGEVPGGLTSLGEKEPMQQSLNKRDSMEATLQSISEELARCRQLLLSQRNQERDSPGEYALHRSPGARQLSASYTPVCVFTLHIGTLVLSDEAVVWSRDRNLVLMWKFYSHSAAMTRVQPGRVAVFDFVTEYDVLLHDQMLNYMKNSEMAIVLCELGKEEKPFAKCCLPLQEALLHANRRADMSLALIPCQTEDSENGQSFGPEVGVLDIWCSLRMDKSLLPAIFRSMRNPSHKEPEWHSDSPAPGESRTIKQASEDEPSRDSSQTRQSRDLGLGRLSRQKRSLSMTMDPTRPSFDNHTRRVSKPFCVPRQENRASERYAEETQEENHQPRFSDFHSFSPVMQKTQLDYGNRGRGGYERYSEPEYQHSEFIINEVPANIRTDSDMRVALEEKVRQDNMTQWPKSEECRSVPAGNQFAKLKSPPKRKGDYVATDSFQDILNKEKQYTRASTNNIFEGKRKSVKYSMSDEHQPPEATSTADLPTQQLIEITILWLALNEECEAMANPNIKRLYVAYSFLGRAGADLETPFSLPKPKHWADKCYFNFKKTFHLVETDLPLLGHMATCRSGGDASTDPRDCVVFTLVSEPPEDPLGLFSCEDVGYAYLYLGDVLAYSGGSNEYTEVVGVHGVRGGICGVLAVRVDNLAVLRLCLAHQAVMSARLEATQ